MANCGLRPHNAGRPHPPPGEPDDPTPPATDRRIFSAPRTDRSVAANGHTPGHSAYLIGSDDDKLLIWGDLVHNHAVQFARPQVAIEFDNDRKAAVATRQKIFARAAKERLLVGGMHLPFPGIGHVRKEAKGYSWVPIEFAPLAE
ncbi:MBL fold metallo-hydrolase [Dechloromonas sp. H13]|uniref:MBL fold metallo-hydrolase n=1 Tax=Dechloromonas sp. H13 TaxID=2570193 RepID=UPI0012911E63|nr:MBL fold metallo-hydrolase [Dechloromonas sp. H13]